MVEVTAEDSMSRLVGVIVCVCVMRKEDELCGNLDGGSVLFVSLKASVEMVCQTKT